MKRMQANNQMLTRNTLQALYHCQVHQGLRVLLVRMLFRQARLFPSVRWCAEQRRHESVWLRMFGGKKYLQEKRQEIARARAELREEISTNFTKDLSEYRHNRGKRTEAPAYVCQKKDSIPAPTLQGTTIGGAAVQFPTDLRGKVTLVVLGLRGISQKVMDMYREPFHRSFASHQACQHYEIHVVEQRVFQPFKMFFASNLRRLVPDPARQQRMLILCPDADGLRDLRNRFKVYNALTGYAALVDSDAQIRWLAHGAPTDTEVQRMIECTQVLLSSVGKK